jgi:hypothetical protein
MKFQDYNILKLSTFDNRKKIFLVPLWVTIVLTIFKFIEGAFFNNLPLIDILRNLGFGLALCALQLLIMEKGRTL